ncbi:phage tail tape measure protein [Chromohalobacter sp. HP20-39]|uniref:phage tail tape measure protein n=1 Tax=Chromohalobacter sp. HP20-39 TaxID=3079306 RepID=UPI00294B33DC|nr:phage tail tape measure protein [Chromohalobacter sp. HP20-39]MDV6319581.1 hypothetical protein [Chromohalobacter sp. HP20-39]
MAKDLSLQVKLQAIDKITKPLKKITQGSGKTAEALKASKEQLKTLNQQQKDVSAYRQTRWAMRGNQRAIRELTEQTEQYTQKQAEQKDRHERIQSSLKSARREYDHLAKAVQKTTEPNAQLSNELEKARIRLNAQQEAADSSGNELKRYRDRIRQANDKVERLNTTQRTQQERLSGVKRRLDEAGIGTDKLGRKARELRGDEERLNDTLEKQKDKLSAVARKQRAAADAAKRYQRLAGRGNAIRGTCATGLATGGVGMAAMTTQALGNEMAGSRLAAQFGEGKSAAAEYREVINNVYSGGRGNGMQDVQRAVGAVGAAFGSLEEQSASKIKSITNQALTLQEVFGVDITESVQTAQNMVKNKLAPNATAAFDLIAKSFQEVPAAMRDELPDILQEYGTNFRALGFSGNEAMSLLVAAADKGRFALDKTGDAVKEFTIRGSDMSKASVAAYDAIGLNASAMSDAVASGGDQARAAMQTTAKAILAIEDPAKRANTAIALFGTPLEDLSVDQIPQFLKALGGTKDRLGDVTGATADAADTLDNNAGKALKDVLRALSGPFMTALEDVRDDIIDVSKAVTGWIKENPELAGTLAKVAVVLAGLVAVGGSFLLVVGSLLGPIAAMRWGLEMFGIKAGGANGKLGKLAKGGIKKLGGGFKWLGSLAGSAGKSLAQLAKGGFTVIGRAGGWLSSILRTASIHVYTLATRALPMLGNALVSLGKGFITLATAIGRAGIALLANPMTWIILGIVAAVAALAGAAYLIYKNWGAISGWFAELWEGIKAKASAAWEWFKTLFDWSPIAAIKAAWSGLGNIVGGAVDLAKADASAAWEMVKALFDWSPIAAIKAAWSGLGTLGGSLIDGLIGGIDEKWQALKDKVSGIGDFITGIFQDDQEIHSPSRVWARLGGHTMEGLAQGIDRGADGPLRGVVNVSRQLKRAGAGMALGAATLPAAAAPDIQAPQLPEMPALRASVERPKLPDLGTLNAPRIETPAIDTRPPLQAQDGGSVTITMGDINVHPSPGMDEQALARYVRAEVERALKEASRDAAARRRSSFHDID